MTEAFERKRAIRSANRGIITKYVKEAIELFSKTDENGCIERLTTLDRLLDEKLKFVRKLDEEILEACSVESIAQDKRITRRDYVQGVRHKEENRNYFDEKTDEPGRWHFTIAYPPY